MKRGDQVIVETARGVEFGNVVMGPKEVKDEEITQPLKTVIRLATEDDRRVEEKNRKKEKEAFQICLEKIHKHGLEMKLIDAEYTFDNNKVLFYFTADGRIDFRQMRRRSAEESGSVDESFAATPICLSLHRFRSRWQKNRICL